MKKQIEAKERNVHDHNKEKYDKLSFQSFVICCKSNKKNLVLAIHLYPKQGQRIKMLEFS
jgi:hypothetical protein